MDGNYPILNPNISDVENYVLSLGAHCCSDTIFYQYWINQDLKIHIPDFINAVETIFKDKI